jgi:Protein of unknown function (DUF4229)
VKEFVVYTAARLGLLLVSYGLVVGIYVLVSGSDQIPLIWPFLVAVVLSAIGSVVLLGRQREAFARVVQSRADRASARFEQARAKEDEPDHRHEQAGAGEGEAEPRREEARAAEDEPER